MLLFAKSFPTTTRLGFYPTRATEHHSLLESFPESSLHVLTCLPQIDPARLFGSR
jgi:hypothetical protein